MIKEKIKINARRSLDALREAQPVEDWGTGRPPPPLDVAAKMAKICWPFSSLFPPEGGTERLLRLRAPPVDPEKRAEHFFDQLMADAAMLFSADAYTVRTKGRK